MGEKSYYYFFYFTAVVTFRKLHARSPRPLVAPVERKLERFFAVFGNQLHGAVFIFSPAAYFCQFIFRLPGRVDLFVAFAVERNIIGGVNQLRSVQNAVRAFRCRRLIDVKRRRQRYREREQRA